MKLYLPLLLLALLSGCSNYFSKYNTVYRIETTTGERYYSDDEPELNEAMGTYEIEDLDGNEYQLDKGIIVEVKKYTHKK